MIISHITPPVPIAEELKLPKRFKAVLPKTPFPGVCEAFSPESSEFKVGTEKP